MRRGLITLSIVLVSFAADAAKFNPDDAMIARISERLKRTLDKSGISGVEQDVLNCYDNTLRDKNAAKECVVYDMATLMLDRQMGQVFVARGMKASSSPLYTNEAFDARSHAYGFPAFQDDKSGQKKVGDAARRVLSKAFP